MPHDLFNQPLVVGDLVTVECRVTAVYPSNDYCNLTLETKEPMFPGFTKTTLSVNAKQVEKVLSEA